MLSGILIISPRYSHCSGAEVHSLTANAFENQVNKAEFNGLEALTVFSSWNQSVNQLI